MRLRDFVFVSKGNKSDLAISVARMGVVFPIIIYILIVNMAGCNKKSTLSTNTKRNETGNKQAWGGYAPGEQYEIISAVFVVGNPSSGYRIMAPTSLIMNSAVDKSLPATVAEYNLSPGSWPGILAVVEPGSRITVTRFERLISLEFTQVSVFANIAGHAFKANDACINGVSERMDSDVSTWTPNPRVLKRIVPATAP